MYVFFERKCRKKQSFLFLKHDVKITRTLLKQKSFLTILKHSYVFFKTYDVQNPRVTLISTVILFMSSFTMFKHSYVYFALNCITFISWSHSSLLLRLSVLVCQVEIDEHCTF